MEVSGGVNRYLGQNEAILWSGFPLTNIHFIAWDAVAVPFCLFVIFILVNNFSNGHFDVVGLIFFGILLYLTFGRFVTKYYNKKRTLYFLTNERIIIFDKSKNQIIQEQDLRSIKHISKKVSRNGVGRLAFGKLSMNQLTGGNSGMDFLATTKLHKYLTKQSELFDEGADQWVPVFYDIEDVEHVYELVINAKKNLNLFVL